MPMISFSDIYLHISKNLINENNNSLKIKDKNDQISILHNLYIFYFIETVARPLVSGMYIIFYFQYIKCFVLNRYLHT